MTDQIKVDPPATTERLLGEMVDLRSDLNRERWHKRALVAVTLGLVFMLGLGVREYIRQNETIARLDDTVARLDDTIAQLQQTRTDALDAICAAQASLINAFTSLQVPPADLTQQWLQQARLDAFEHEVEHDLAPLHCDLHLDPIKPPPLPPPTASTQPSSERAPPTTQPLLFTFPLPTTTTPPTMTPVAPPATTKPQPPTTPPATTPPTKKPKKPKKPKPPHP